MTNYSENPGSVRVDKFKRRSGKWYHTFAADMSDYWDGHAYLIHEAVTEAIKDAEGATELDLDYWIYVVNEPYHEHSHPVMLKKFEPDA